MMIRTALVAGVLCTLAAAQLPSTTLPDSVDMPYQYFSGVHVNATGNRMVMDTHVLHVTGAPSLRVLFSDVELGPDDEILVTSSLDGYYHPIDTDELRKWQSSSAAFNGDTLVLKLWVAAGSRAKYSIHAVNHGLPLLAPESICGNDDRVPSSDPRVARFQSSPTASGGACTIWMGGANNCAWSAGHCFDGGGLQWAEFNPPLSNPSGSFNHSPPQDQYPIDNSTVMYVDGGTGNDYGACLLQTNFLGQTANSNQGAFNLGFFVPSLNSTIRITGHGSDSGTSNQIQQTHTGPLVQILAGGDRLNYVVDTTGGSSGSPVIDEASGDAVGIHTHAGCNPPNTGNNGTSLTHGGIGPIHNALCNVDQISVISGDNQFASINGVFTLPLICQVTNATTGAAVGGATVNFAVTGNASLSASSVTTTSGGLAIVNATAGAVSGAVTVTATSPGVSGSATFNLFVRGLRLIHTGPTLVVIVDETTSGSPTVPYLLMAGNPGQATFPTFIGDLCMNPLDVSQTVVFCDGFGFFGFISANGNPCVGAPGMIQAYSGASGLTGQTLSFQGVGYNPGADPGGFGYWITNCVTQTF